MNKVNPYTDFGFRKLFGTKAYRDIVNANDTAHRMGFEKGKAEGIARQMKSMGLSSETIQKATGLTLEEIKAL